MTNYDIKHQSFIEENTVIIYLNDLSRLLTSNISKYPLHTAKGFFISKEESMQYTYKTRGTCSVQIVVDYTGNVIDNVAFLGGCNGNLKGISALVKGKTFDEVIGQDHIVKTLVNQIKYDKI